MTTSTNASEPAATERVDAVLRRPALAGWDGFGVVVQAYGKRVSATIDWLYSRS